MRCCCFRHCTVAAAALLAAAAVRCRCPDPALPGACDGRRDVRHLRPQRRDRSHDVARGRFRQRLGDPSTGRFGDVVLNRFEAKYDADWQPTEMRLEAHASPAPARASRRRSASRPRSTRSRRTARRPARPIRCRRARWCCPTTSTRRTRRSPSGWRVAGAGRRDSALRGAAGRGEADGQGHRPARRCRRRTARVRLRKYAITIQNVGAVVDGVVTVDSRNRFAAPRDARRCAFRRPHRPRQRRARAVRPRATRPTSDVTIPDGRLQRRRHARRMPPGEGRLRHPTIVLVAGSGQVDRDETRRGHPDLRAAAPARWRERGFMVLRYDKRGVGQSGGRIEAATLQDYADDVIGHRQVARQSEMTWIRGGLRSPATARADRSGCWRRRARRRSPRWC